MSFKDWLKRIFGLNSWREIDKLPNWVEKQYAKSLKKHGFGREYYLKGKHMIYKVVLSRGFQGDWTTEKFYMKGREK